MRPAALLGLLAVVVACSSSTLTATSTVPTNPNDQTGPCRFANANVTITIAPGESFTVSRSSLGSQLLVNNANCYGASTSNVKGLTIKESATGPQTVILDYSTGFFALGSATNRGVVLNYGTDPEDTLEILGPNAAVKVMAGSNGFNLNGDGFVDVSFTTQPSIVNVTLGPGADTFSGGGDAVTGAPFPQTMTINGGNGNDTLQGGNGNDVILGGGGADLLLASAASNGSVDSFDGGDGIDTVSYAQRVNDVLAGFGANAQADAIAETVEILVGGNGNDTLFSSPDVTLYKTLQGGPGNDTFMQSPDPDSHDILSGGPGNDTADYSARSVNLVISLDNAANDGAQGEADNVLGDVENITAGSGFDSIYGNSNDNILNGGGGVNVIQGGPGNDTFFQGTDTDNGNDVIYGGDGVDTVDYSLRTRDLFVVLDGLTPSGDMAIHEYDIIYDSMENIIGGNGNDTLTGNANANVLVGNAGNDTLYGLGGDDTLDGGDGQNPLSCGPGNDIALNGNPVAPDCELVSP